MGSGGERWGCCGVVLGAYHMLMSREISKTIPAVGLSLYNTKWWCGGDDVW